MAKKKGGRVTPTNKPKPNPFMPAKATEPVVRPMTMGQLERLNEKWSAEKEQRAHKGYVAVRYWQADDSGCFWDRCLTPGTSMEGRTEFRSEYNMELRPEDCINGKIDLLVGCRISTDDAWRQWQYMIKAEMPPTIYEVDDNLFHVEPGNTNPVLLPSGKWTTVGAYEFFSSEHTQKLMASSVMAADAVVVSCTNLAEFYGRMNENVYVIPNYLPERYLDPLPAKDSGPIRVGWAGGSSHYHDMLQAAPGIQAALHANPQAEMHIYGQDYSDLFKPKAHWHQWQKDKGVYLRKLDLDIGLCPLRDSYFNSCKTPVKALEYAFRGIPTIADDVTPYREFVKHGVTGFLVNGADEWRDAVGELINNHDLRNHLAANAFEFAKQWTAEGHAEERAAIYRQVIDRGPVLRAVKYKNFVKQLEDRQRFNPGLPNLAA